MIESPGKISVVIPTYNGMKYLPICLDSLYQQTYGNFDIVIVDNASNDGTVDFLKTNYPKIKIIANNKNLGFAKANNKGVKYALAHGSRYIVITCQDDRFQSNFLEEGVKILEQEGVGMGTPKIMYDNTNRLWWAGGKLLSTKELIKSPTIKIGEHVGKREEDKGQYNTMTKADALTGNALFVKKEVFDKIGYFDERYFLYGDDIDFSVKARKAGYDLIYFPTTTAFHMTPLKRKQKRTLKQLFLKFKRYLTGLTMVVVRQLKWYEKIIWFIKLPVTLAISLVKDK